jgi:signal transduction histidine kinase/DNA-binding NarL/FixJ family response regulator
MPNCFVLDSASLDRTLLETVCDSDEWRVQYVDAVEALDRSAPSPDVVLFDSDLETESRAALMQHASRRDRAVPVVCLVEDGDVEGATRALRDGASDYVFESQLRTEEALDVLRAILERHGIEMRDRQLRDRLQKKSSELLGINALANGISSSLDRSTIIRRGLWIFAGMCQRGGAALLELTPSPSLLKHDPTSDEKEDDEIRLECTKTFSADGSSICGDIELDESWTQIVYDERSVTLESPDDETLSGLETFWESHPEGRLNILSLRGNRRPIGALILAEFEPSEASVPMTREGLHAMAVQFGAALENARLFTEVKEAYDSLRETQEKLVRAEKFASVGVLAAEIAHEINNPASFVISNLSVMQEYADTLATFLDDVDERVGDVSEPLADELEQLRDEYEIQFLREDIEALLSRSLSGMQRIHQIVQDLRYLSRDSGGEPGWIELESLLDATVNLVGHEAKFRANLERDYTDVPQVMSDASRLSQVFLNLLVNAVQSLDVGDAENDYIRIATERRGDEVCVSIEDSGEGISEDVQPKIFEPFFTTKETGEGTGLGLSISRDIVESLGGRIEFESEPGEGSVFRVVLPIRPETFAEDEELRDSGFYEKPPGLDELSDEIFEK